jgi:hypothetical protein
MEQVITTKQVVEFLGYIIPFIVGFFTVRYYIRVEREKYATKEFVKQEMRPVETKVIALEEDIKDQKDDLKYIRRRLDEYLDSKARIG